MIRFKKLYVLSLSDLVTPQFQFGLGICLYQGLDGQMLEAQLFNVADLVNKGKATQRSELAELNLRTAKKAHKMAAFQSSAHYIANGIMQLPSDVWKEHRNLALELYSLGAEVNMALGNIELGKEYIRTVLDRDEYTPMETMRVKMTKMEILGNIEARHSDAVDFGVQVLKEIGYKFVWSRNLVSVQALALVGTTVKRLEKVPVDHFESLSLMKDKRHRAIINLLSKLCVISYTANDVFFAFICTCKVIE